GECQSAASHRADDLRTRVLQTPHSATTNQAANGACRTVSSIGVPPAEAGVEDTADLWFTARNKDVRHEHLWPCQARLVEGDRRLPEDLRTYRSTLGKVRRPAGAP